jgi:tetratricopeptide (TPR) repeat protein
MREEFQLPQWLTPVAAVLLFIGLVIIAAAAWIQAHPASRKDPEAPTPWEVDLVDLKESVTRGSLPHLTWARAIIGGVFVFSLFFGFAGLYVLLTGRAPSVPGPNEAIASAAPGIAVLPFRVVGGPEVEVWREGLVDLLAPNLDGVAGLRANDPRTLLNRWRREAGDANEEPDLQVALAIAEGIGARYGILGSAVDMGSGVRITANIYDVGTGDQIGSAQVEGTADGVLTLVDELSIQVIQQILAVAPDDLPQFDVSEITTTSLTALKAYLEGEQKSRRGLWKEAITDYERAIEEDSTFALALHGISLAYGWDEGFTQRAREYSSRAANHADRLPERAAALVRAHADMENYFRSSIEALRNLTRRYPDDVNAQTALADAHYHMGGRAGYSFETTAQEFHRALELDPSHGPAYIHLLGDAFQRRDSAAAQMLLQTYANLNPASDQTIGYSLLYDLAWGDSLAQGRARSALDTMSADLVHRAVAQSQYTGAYPWEPSLLAVRALTDDIPRTRHAGRAERSPSGAPNP